MVMEPIGTPRLPGICTPLILETANDDILPFNASMPPVEIKLVDKELMVAALMLPLIVLKLKVPIMFAVIVPVLTKTEDMFPAVTV
jgi:hypothetical protein